MRVRLTVLLSLILVSGLLQGCGTTPLTPSQTAQHFWAAMLNQDQDNATYYATHESAPRVIEQISDYRQATVSFGQVSIQSEAATIETTLHANKAVEDSSPAPATTFMTVLQREQEQWRVDYLKTRESLEKAREKKGLSKIVDDLNELGRRFSGKIDESLKHWEEAKPELKRDLEDLGESVQKEVEDAMEKYGPEIQRNLQDLTDSLDDAIKKLEKPLPKQKKDQQQPEREQEQTDQSEGRMI